MVKGNMRRAWRGKHDAHHANMSDRQGRVTRLIPFCSIDVEGEHTAFGSDRQVVDSNALMNEVGRFPLNDVRNRTIQLFGESGIAIARNSEPIVICCILHAKLNAISIVIGAC